MKLLLTEEIELSPDAYALLRKIHKDDLHMGFDEDRLIGRTPASRELRVASLVEDTGKNFYYTIYRLSARGHLAYNACISKS